MKTLSLNILDSYAAMTAEQKEAVLSSILLDELYWEDDFRVRLGELLTTEQDDALLSRIIEMLGGGCLADAEFRNRLSVICGKYSKNSLSYNAIRELMITAFFVNSEDVKSWGAAQLKEKEKIDPSNETKLVNYLKNLLNDFNLPVRLRWHAGLFLANQDSSNAIDALIDFARHLIKGLPKKQTDNYYDSKDWFLAEKIAYCIGFAADKIQSTSQLNKAAEFIRELDQDSSSVQWATERIEKQITIIFTTEPIIPNIMKWITDFWIPEGAGQMLSAADLAAQEKSFLGGTVKIICDFGGEDGDDPAYIWLLWNALETSENSELVIRLINPDTEELLFEIHPGNLKHGEQTFTSHELGFHPAKNRWAIAIEIQDKPE